MKWIFGGSLWGIMFGVAALRLGVGLVDYGHVVEARAYFGAQMVAEPGLTSGDFAAGGVTLALLVALAGYLAFTRPDAARLIRVLAPAGAFGALGWAGAFVYWLLFQILPMKGVG